MHIFRMCEFSNMTTIVIFFTSNLKKNAPFFFVCVARLVRRSECTSLIKSVEGISSSEERWNMKNLEKKTIFKQSMCEFSNMTTIVIFLHPIFTKKMHPIVLFCYLFATASHKANSEELFNLCIFHTDVMMKIMTQKDIWI